MLAAPESEIKILFLTGIPRSGKSFLAKFVAEFSNSGIFNINNEVEALHYLFHKKELSRSSFSFLLSYGIKNHLYESQIGRRWNMRPSEESSVFNSKNLSGIVSGVFAEQNSVDGGVFFEKNSSHSILLHSAASYADLLLQCFPKAMVLNVFSDPLEVINAWEKKSYGDLSFYQQERYLSLPLIQYNGRNLPIYALGWVDEFLSMSPVQRITRMVCELFQRDQKVLKSLDDAVASRVLLLSYKDALLDTESKVMALKARLISNGSDIRDPRVLFPDKQSRVGDVLDTRAYKKYILNNVSQSDADNLEDCVEVFQEWNSIKI